MFVERGRICYVLFFIPADDSEEEEWFRGGCISMACCWWWTSKRAGGGISMSGGEQSTGPSEGCWLTFSAPFVCLSSARGGNGLTTDEAFSRPSWSKIMTLNREFPLYLNNIILSRISRLNFSTKLPHPAASTSCSSWFLTTSIMYRHLFFVSSSIFPGISPLKRWTNSFWMICGNTFQEIILFERAVCKQDTKWNSNQTTRTFWAN